MIEFSRLYCLEFVMYFLGYLKGSEYAIATYYPGQQLRGELGCLERATWLQKSIFHCPLYVRKDKLREVFLTVESVGISRDYFSTSSLCARFT